MLGSNPTATNGRRCWGLVAISVAVSLIIVDSTIVNVAVPYLIDDLALTSSEVQWIQESYTLVFAATLLVWGTVADRIGRRRMLLIGLIVFLAASVAAALAGSGGILIATRIVQGLGGAMILPTTLSLINAGFTGRERGIAFAVWGSTIGGVVALGPLLGGWLTTAFSWRWAFGINLPIGLIVMAGVLLTVMESKSPQSRRVDAGGVVLSAATFALLAFGLIEGRTYGWWAAVRPFDIGQWRWPGETSPVPFALGLSLILGAVRRSGEASGVQSTSRQIGSALGIAVLGTVLFTSVGVQLDSALRQANLPDNARTAIVQTVVDSAGAAIPALAENPATAPAAELARQVFTDGTRYAAFTAAGFLLIGLAASFSLGSGRRPEPEDTRPSERELQLTGS